MPETIRLLSWNVHGCVGRDRCYDLKRVIALLQEIDADILALQEVDSRGRCDDGSNPFVLVRKALGLHGTEAKAILTDDGDYGQLLLSRWPLAHIQVHDLSCDGREPRRAIEVRVEGDAASGRPELRVFSTHLGLVGWERRRQMAQLLRAVEAGPDGPVVMLGDFNDWNRSAARRTQLRRRFPMATDIRTFPVGWPLLPLDRVYGSAGIVLERQWTDSRFAAASDHLPIIADLSFRSISTAAPKASHGSSDQEVCAAGEGEGRT